MSDEIRKRLAEIEATRAAMPAEARARLEEEELIAQRESWIRGMGACEHGNLDWEQCAECMTRSDNGESEK